VKGGRLKVGGESRKEEGVRSNNSRRCKVKASLPLLGGD